MNCFPCFQSKDEKSENENGEVPVAQPVGADHPAYALPPATPPANNATKPSHEAINTKDEANTTANTSTAKAFTFRELASATKNFRQECLLGEGGFGRVYKATLSGQVVAVKQLDRNGMQGSREFSAEVSSLCQLNHPNLIKLIGYCADGDQRLLVLEYLPFGSLHDHLFGDKKPMDWLARMRIASGAAQGIEYLHERANPPVLYRDIKSSNILLDEEGNARLTDFGLAKLGLGGGKSTMTPRVVGNYGYCAPEYERTGELTMKSDVYSFGVVMLELLTGRRAIDTTRPSNEQNLVSWAQPYFKDPRKFPELADPLLHGKFPVKNLNQAVGVVAMCLQEEPAVRPLMGDVVAALGFLTIAQDDFPSVPDPIHASDDTKVSSEEEDSSDEEDMGSDEDEDCSEGSGSETDQDESPQVKTKKTVKWASKCKSKGKSQDETVGSSSIKSHKGSSESYDGNIHQNSISSKSGKKDSGSSLRKNSSKVRSEDIISNSSNKKMSGSGHLSKVKSRDASFHSSTSHNSYMELSGKWESDSGEHVSNLKYQHGSSDSSSSEDDSDAEFQGINYRQNSNVSPKCRDFSSDLRQASNSSAELQDESVSNLRQHSNMQSREWSILSTSSNGYGAISSFNSQAGYEDETLRSASE